MKRGSSRRKASSRCLGERLLPGTSERTDFAVAFESRRQLGFRVGHRGLAQARTPPQSVHMMNLAGCRSSQVAYGYAGNS